MKKESDYNFFIEDYLAIISDNGRQSLQLNLVSWNDRPAGYDLRIWYHDKDGQERPGKGITMDLDALRTLSIVLRILINDYDKDAAADPKIETLADVIARKQDQAQSDAAAGQLPNWQNYLREILGDDYIEPGEMTAARITNRKHKHKPVTADLDALDAETDTQTRRI